jgi:hypothetical protein
MANEFKHLSVGTQMTQAEYEAVGGHVLACQATGDIIYASSGSQLSRLGKGAANTILAMGGSCIPAWTASPSVTDLTIGGGCITLSAATDIDLLDNNASALSFDASGKTGIIDIVTTNCSEGVTMSGTLGVTGVLTATGGIELSHACQNTLTGSGGDVSIEGNIIYRAGGTDVPVADGGTGASTLTDGGILLGSGTGAVTAMAVLAAGAIVKGDGSGDPVALTRGSNNQILTTKCCDISWACPATASVATSITASANNCANETVYPTFVDGATGTQGIETDTGLTYNPSTGLLTATGFSGNLTGTLQTASQTNITAVGTITTGTWQGTAIASGYIAGDAITGAKIADDAIDSEHYTDGSIDTAHLAADAITGAKIADDAIDSEHYTDGSIDTAHIADDQVTLAKMAGLTRGSMIIGDSSGNPTALAKGNANYVLTSDGTDIAWAAASGGGTTINNNTANRLVTVAACTDELCGEANLTFDGTTLCHSTTGGTAYRFARYDAGAYPSTIQFRKSRGTSVGSLCAVQSGDRLGRIAFEGADGDSFESGAYIEVLAGATWSGSNTQTYMDTYLTPSGGSTTNTLTTRLTSDGQLRLKDGSASAPALSFHCDTNSGIYSIADDQVGIAAGGAMQWTIQNGPTFFNDTSSGTVGKGVVLNQGASDLPVLEFKSTDITSGLTSLPGQWDDEVDTFASFGKAHVTDGGLMVHAITCGLPTFHVQAMNGTDGTSKSAAASCAVFRFQAWARNANANTSRAYATDANIMMIQTVDNGSGYTRFIFDQEGSFHADVGSTTYDDYCDIELMKGVLAETVPCYRESFKERFGRDIIYNRCWYEENKIIGKDSIHWEDRPHKGWEQRAMINFTGLAMLHHSTIIQLADKVDARLTALENKLALGDGNGDNI